MMFLAQDGILGIDYGFSQTRIGVFIFMGHLFSPHFDLSFFPLNLLLDGLIFSSRPVIFFPSAITFISILPFRWAFCPLGFMIGDF